ncbi:MAG: type II secretion system protein [Planctomycetota bacterium]|jgi:prepilin-type N-terminal cleavage/methylation domain-containing protein/prepilin-type processing-associated H-X9-DG protein
MLVSRPSRSRGFTIVEMLVVIGVIALLIGLLLPALSGARKRAAKTKELTQLRQIGQAWNMYANYNDGFALPGYVDPEVQGIPSDANYGSSWKVSYDFPDHTDIPPETAAPWTWRLLSYLDYDHELVHGYLDEPEPPIFAFNNPDLDTAELYEEAQEMAVSPAFGYNANYIGGWWEMADVDGQMLPRSRFTDVESNEGRRVSVVSRRIANIRRSAEVLTFCSAAVRDVGLHKRTEADSLGSHYVVPPFLAQASLWQGGQGDPFAIQVLEPQTAAPAGRHTGNVAVLYADGHVNAVSPSGMLDLRLWIDAADRNDFRHFP